MNLHSNLSLKGEFFDLNSNVESRNFGHEIVSKSELEVDFFKSEFELLRVNSKLPFILHFCRNFEFEFENGIEITLILSLNRAFFLFQFKLQF